MSKPNPNGKDPGATEMRMTLLSAAIWVFLDIFTIGLGTVVKALRG